MGLALQEFSKQIEAQNREKLEETRRQLANARASLEQIDLEEFRPIAEGYKNSYNINEAIGSISEELLTVAQAIPMLQEETHQRLQHLQQEEQLTILDLTEAIRHQLDTQQTSTEAALDSLIEDPSNFDIDDLFTSLANDQKLQTSSALDQIEAAYEVISDNNLQVNITANENGTISLGSAAAKTPVERSQGPEEEPQYVDKVYRVVAQLTLETDDTGRFTHQTVEDIARSILTNEQPTREHILHAKQRVFVTKNQFFKDYLSALGEDALVKDAVDHVFDNSNVRQTTQEILGDIQDDYGDLTIAQFKFAVTNRFGKLPSGWQTPDQVAQMIDGEVEAIEDFLLSAATPGVHYRQSSTGIQLSPEGVNFIGSEISETTPEDQALPEIPIFENDFAFAVALCAVGDEDGNFHMQSLDDIRGAMKQKTPKSSPQEIRKKVDNARTKLIDQKFLVVSGGQNWTIGQTLSEETIQHFSNRTTTASWEPVLRYLKDRYSSMTISEFRSSVLFNFQRQGGQSFRQPVNVDSNPQLTSRQHPPQIDTKNQDSRPQARPDLSQHAEQDKDFNIHAADVISTVLEMDEDGHFTFNGFPEILQHLAPHVEPDTPAYKRARRFVDNVKYRFFADGIFELAQEDPSQLVSQVITPAYIQEQDKPWQKALKLARKTFGKATLEEFRQGVLNRFGHKVSWHVSPETHSPHIQEYLSAQLQNPNTQNDYILGIHYYFTTDTRVITQLGAEKLTTTKPELDTFPDALTWDDNFLMGSFLLHQPKGLGTKNVMQVICSHIKPKNGGTVTPLELAQTLDYTFQGEFETIEDWLIAQREIDADQKDRHTIPYDGEVERKHARRLKKIFDYFLGSEGYVATHSDELLNHPDLDKYAVKLFLFLVSEIRSNSHAKGELARLAQEFIKSHH